MLIQQLLRGEIDPGRAAERASRFAGLSSEAVDELDLALVEAGKRERTDGETLVRLGRFNHELSLRLGVEPLIAQTAFTLSQFLRGGPAAVEERARLVELALPILEREQRPRSLMARVYQHAAVSLFEASAFLSTPERKRQTIDYGLRALEFLEEFDVPLEAFWYLHLAVGTMLNELEGATEEDLATSVEHMERALDLARRLGRKEQMSSTLNNLGNSLRLLGALTADEAVLERAVGVLEEALPFRESGENLERTQGNLEAVQRCLEEVRAGKGVPAPREQPEPSEGLFEVKIAAGEKYLKTLLRAREILEEEKTELLTRGVETLYEALSELPPGQSEFLRARGEFGLGIALNQRDTSAEASLGVCFLQAARRRFEQLGQQRRTAAAHYNLGEGFSTILDWGEHRSYLAVAANHFERAQHEFEKQGAHQQAYQSLLMRAGCYREMAKVGDNRYLERSRELFREAGVSEEELKEIEVQENGQDQQSQAQGVSGNSVAAGVEDGHSPVASASSAVRWGSRLRGLFRRLLSRMHRGS